MRTQYTRLTAAGNVKGSAGTLMWVNASNPTAGGLTVKFNNATSGTGSDVFEVEVGANDTKFLIFPGNFYFTTGIRCGTLENGLIVTAGYA